MADTQTQDPPAASASPPIAALAGGGDDSSVSGLISGLRDLQRKKLQQDDKMTGQMDATMAKDKAIREKAFAQEGVDIAEMPQKWDADKEHKKFETNPIEGFGSLGGMFAMVASAFTKAPMENAINGMAGAITAIKDGKEQDYQRAFGAFKENVKLADQRFKMQHELYSDALSLAQTDMAAMEAKMRNAAVRFGDQKALFLLDHGMSQELFELQASRAKAQEGMMKAADAIDLHTVTKAAVDSVKANPPNTGDPVRDKMLIAAQIHNIYAGGGNEYGSAEQEAVGAFMRDAIKNNKKPEEIIDGLSKIKQDFSAKAPNYAGYNAARQKWESEHPGETIPADEDSHLQQMFGLVPQPRAGAAAGAPTMTKEEAQAVEEEVQKGMSRTEAIAKVRAAAKPGGGKNPLTHDREIAAAAQAHREEARKTHPDWTEEQLDADEDSYVKGRRTASAAPSGNRADDNTAKINQTKYITELAQENLDFLRQHAGAAGLMGKIMRGEEIAENIIGAGTQTDRAAFRRRVLELQEMVPRIITDSNGRPLKSAQDKIDGIVAGLSAGDTGPNTIRAMEDLIKQMQERAADYGVRRSGGTQAPATGAPEPSAGGGRPLWESAPTDPGEQHSSAGSAPPVEGARKAPDGNWYVDDPARPGKFLKVMVS